MEDNFSYKKAEEPNRRQIKFKSVHRRVDF